MLEMIVKVLMALAVVAFVGYPLLKVETDEEPDEVLSEEAEELLRRKESTYSAIKELEFDYKTGKLSERDFQELDAKYRAEAIEILEAIDLLESEESGEGGQAAPRSGRQAKKARSRVSAEPGSLTALVCAECGRDNPAGSRFCASCGEALGEVEITAAPENGSDQEAEVCEDCGSPVAAGHRFCASCGAQVRV